jgi:hypothetical protein
VCAPPCGYHLFGESIINKKKWKEKFLNKIVEKVVAVSIPNMNAFIFYKMN